MWSYSPLQRLSNMHTKPTVAYSPEGTTMTQKSWRGINSGQQWGNNSRVITSLLLVLRIHHDKVQCGAFPRWQTLEKSMTGGKHVVGTGRIRKRQKALSLLGWMDPIFLWHLLPESPFQVVRRARGGRSSSHVHFVEKENWNAVRPGLCVSNV